MKLLILGGSRFLGRHLVDAALAAGHEVTLFNRGRTLPGGLPEVEQLRGDRSVGDLRSLTGRSWDAAIDVPTDQPSWVEASCQRLHDAVDHFTFVSSISVHACFESLGLDEDAPVATCPPEELQEPPHYGARKAVCETLVRASFGSRSLVLRPGLIVGPGDPSDRFTYWPRRLARGGEVLAPGDGTTPAQLIDVRDLARWTISMIEGRVSGVFHATGPERAFSLREMLRRALAAVGSEAILRWIDESTMEAHGIRPWIDLPVFVGASSQGMLAVDISRALAAGLRFRALEETVRDTLAWDRTRPADTSYQAGLDPELERAVLATL